MIIMLIIGFIAIAIVIAIIIKAVKGGKGDNKGTTQSNAGTGPPTSKKAPLPLAASASQGTGNNPAVEMSRVKS